MDGDASSRSLLDVGSQVFHVAFGDEKSQSIERDDASERRLTEESIVLRRRSFALRGIDETNNF